MRQMLQLLAVLIFAGCASAPPARYVIERDLGAYKYRRYQKTLDIEVPIDGNDAVGHTASYIERRSDTELAVSTAVVTVYAHAASLAAEVRARLKTLSTYVFSVHELDGAHVWQLDDTKGERWAVWVSDHYLVKIGAPAAEDFPDDVASAYLSAYPSDLDEHGMAKDGATSAGAAKETASEEQEQDMPASLREGAPR